MERLTIRRAELEDVEVMARIMEETVRQLERPEFFVPDSPEFIRRHIREEGFSLLALWDGEPAGFLIVCRPGRAANNLGRDLGYPEEALDRVVHMESAAVLPRYRGHGIQGKLVAHAEVLAAGEGFDTALCTVHPENIASLRTMERAGYRVELTREKYGGRLRHILRKDLSCLFANGS